MYRFVRIFKNLMYGPDISMYGFVRIFFPQNLGSHPVEFILFLLSNPTYSTYVCMMLCSKYTIGDFIYHLFQLSTHIQGVYDPYGLGSLARSRIKRRPQLSESEDGDHSVVSGSGHPPVLSSSRQEGNNWSLEYR